MLLLFAALLSRWKPTGCSPLHPWHSERRAWHLLFRNFLLLPFCLVYWAEFAKMLPATSISSYWALGSDTWCAVSFVGQNFDRLSWSLDPWKSCTICHDYKKNHDCCVIHQRQRPVLGLYQWLRIWNVPLLKIELFLKAACIKNITTWMIKKKIRKVNFIQLSVLWISVLPPPQAWVALLHAEQHFGN